MENTRLFPNSLSEKKWIIDLYSSLYKNIEYIYTVYPLIEIKCLNDNTNNNSLFYTDGKYIYINNNLLYNKNNEILLLTNKIIAEYAHTLFHFLLHHALYNIYGATQSQHSLICDIFTEYILYKYQVNKSCKNCNEKCNVFSEIINNIHYTEKKNNTITYEKIFNYIKDLKKDKLEYLTNIFSVDNHQSWINKNTESNQNKQTDKNNKTDSKSKEKEKENNNKNNSIIHDSIIDLLLNKSQFSSDTNKEKLNSVTKLFTNSLYQNTNIINNELMNSIMYEKIQIKNYNKKSYFNLLSNFFNTKEIRKVDIDSYDNIYYTLGLNMYKSIPLIENLETKTAHTIENFFIAVDTSGSVRGYKIRNFIYNIVSLLLSIDRNTSFNKIHIIQCDCKIQNTFLIREKKDLINLINNFYVYGYGLTDYNPVLNFIEDFKIKNSSQKINGLIYFTDGFGQMPNKNFSYKYLFCNENNNILCSNI